MGRFFLRLRTGLRFMGRFFLRGDFFFFFIVEWGAGMHSPSHTLERRFIGFTFVARIVYPLRVGVWTVYLDAE